MNISASSGLLILAVLALVILLPSWGIARLVTGGSEMSAGERVKNWEPAGGFWNRPEGAGWRVERGFLDRSARCGGLARLAGRVWAHVSWQVRSGQVGLAYGPISNPRIMKRSSPAQLGK